MDAWRGAAGNELLDMCECIGVARRFCRNGVPPAFDDDGLRERLAQQQIPHGGLYIVGPVGSHKTHLACARAVDAARRGFTALVLKWSAFLLEVRDSYRPHCEWSEAEIIKRYIGLDYLAVDDFGLGRDDRTRESEAVARLAYELMDGRYERGSECITDITTNLTPVELAGRFDERIARRVQEMTSPYVMLLNGDAPGDDNAGGA